MAEQWAILASSGLIFIALGIIVFYIIPLQARLVLKEVDWLTGLRWRLLAVSVFIAIAASPIITNRIIRNFGVESTLLSNISALAIGFSFLAFAISLVSVYHYKHKDDDDKDKE
jgi:hypothetical protein